MDIQMPIMDGVAATKLIRKLSNSNSQVPIIAMTANVFEEDIKHYLASGMSDYISKPFEIKVLTQKITKHLMGIDTTSQKKDNSDEHMNAVVSYTNIDFLKQFTNNDAQKMMKYIGMFLDNAPKLLSRLEQGMTQLNYEEVKIAAHSLKPQMSYMGIDEELSHIFMIEQLAGSQTHTEQLPNLVANLKRVCEEVYRELNHISL
jgi:DNA-binding response OmpR family regulator